MSANGARSRASSRRRFLSAALVGLAAKTDRPITGTFVFRSEEAGHLLRERRPLPRTRETRRIPLVIVGGGISGLSVAWRLEKRGFRDFVLLEMEADAGGNARWGENQVSAYPWAAHYIPVPGPKAALVRELLEEFGVLKDGYWEERYLCHSPQERLFIHGRWQDGLEPDADHQEFARLAGRFAEFRSTAEFTIPMERGVRPSALDRISFRAWLEQNGFRSRYVHWYMDYCCRDDYGALSSETSAWAGIHYFASREPDDKGPLTWPEGNGWIVRRLLAKLSRYVRTGAMVWRITREGARWRVATEKADYICDAVIFAAPTYLAPYLVENAAPLKSFQYSPWIVANLTLDRLPREPTLESAWDNVIFDSPSLGYVVATHQSLRSRIDRTVWTYYWALAQGAPADNRHALMARDWDYWKEAILGDLSRAHPGIRQCVARIDVFRMGHAMIRPTPGFLFSDERRRMARLEGRLLFANSDLSGLSLFEEAQYRGVKAAERALEIL